MTVMPLSRMEFALAGLAVSIFLTDHSPLTAGLAVMLFGIGIVLGLIGTQRR